MTARISDKHIERPAPTTILVDGVAVAAIPGESVAAALLASGIAVFRRSPRDGTPRGPFCFMGVCQECVVTIDGRPAVACQQVVREGMSITLARPR